MTDQLIAPVIPSAAGRVPAAADALLPRVLVSATPSAALLTSLLDPAGLSDALR